MAREWGADGAYGPVQKGWRDSAERRGWRGEGREADPLISPSAPQICLPGPHSAQSKAVRGTAASASAARGPAGSLPPPCSSRVSLKASARGRCPLSSRWLSPPTPDSAASPSPASLATW